MTKSTEQLILTLEKESEIYRDILSIAYQKSECIRDQNIEALEKLANEEQGLVIALFKMEEVREKVVDLMMREYNVEFVQNLSELAEFMPLEAKQKVLEAKDKLLVLVKNTSDENRFNQRLLEERLAMIQVNIDLLTQLNSSGAYDKKANNEAFERKNIFDARV